MAKTKKESDPLFEIAFYEGILKNSPNFVEALMALGDLYTKGGFYEKGLSVDERLSSLRPNDSRVQYNLACSYALLNNVPKARTAMRRAFALGYTDLDYLEKDPDLLNLLTDAAFGEDLKEARLRLDQAVRDKTGEER